MVETTGFVAGVLVVEKPPPGAPLLVKLVEDTDFGFKKKGAKSVSAHIALPQGGFADAAHGLEAYLEGDLNDLDTMNIVWPHLETAVVANALDGVSSSVMLYGPHVDKGPMMLDPTNGLLAMVVKHICLTDKMEAMGMDLTGTMTCIEIASEKIRDVMAKETTYTDRKLRSTRPFIENLKEVPINPENVSLVQTTALKEVDSNLIITLNYKLKDCGVIRSSYVTLVLIGRQPDKNFQRGSSEATPDPLRHHSASHFARVFKTAGDLAHKRKKAFVPFKDSVLTSILAECISTGAVKTTVVGFGAPSDVNPDAAREANVEMIKFLSRIRSIHMTLKQNEEAVSLTDIKQEMDLLKKKLEATNVNQKEELKQKEVEYAQIQQNLKEQLVGLTKEKEEKSQQYEKLRMERERRDQELMQIQERLRDKQIAAADASKALEELIELERLQDEADRRMQEEERMRIVREAELQEAKELEIQLEQVRQDQVRREEEARRELRTIQARAMASLFRSAFSILKDKEKSREIKKNIERLSQREGELDHEIDVINRKMHAANKHRLGVRSMSQMAEAHEEKMRLKKKEHDDAFAEHLHAFVEVIQEMKDKEAQIRRDLQDISRETDRVMDLRRESVFIQREETCKKMKEDAANFRLEAASVKEQVEALQKESEEKRTKLNTVRSKIRELEVTRSQEEARRENFDREIHYLKEDIEALEHVEKQEENRLQENDTKWQETKDQIQQLLEERTLLEKNHHDLVMFMDAKHRRLHEASGGEVSVHFLGDGMDASSNTVEGSGQAHGGKGMSRIVVAGEKMRNASNMIRRINGVANKSQVTASSKG